MGVPLETDDDAVLLEHSQTSPAESGGKMTRTQRRVEAPHTHVDFRVKASMKAIYSLLAVVLSAMAPDYLSRTPLRRLPPL